MGMKKFSLQSYQRRCGVCDWFFNRILRRNDVLALRYNFVEAYLNGDRLGLYIVEETFDKYLVENNNYREGPILKFDEENFWDNRIISLFNKSDIESVYLSAVSPTSAQKRPSGLFLNSVILPFKASDTFKNPILKANFLRGRDLLYHFRKGD